MTSRIVPSTAPQTKGVPTYDLYDQGSAALLDATLEEVQAFLADVDEMFRRNDMDFSEFYKDRHPTDGSCWCGYPAVAHVYSVDPRDGTEFGMPRCLGCLIGPRDTTVYRGSRNWVDVHKDGTVDLYEGEDALLVNAPWSDVQDMLTGGRG